MGNFLILIHQCKGNWVSKEHVMKGNSVTRPVILNFDLLLSSSEIGLKVSLMYFMNQINITSQFVEGWVPQSTHWNWNELNSIEVSCA